MAMRFGEPPAALTGYVKGHDLVELVARTAHKLRFSDPVT